MKGVGFKERHCLFGVLSGRCIGRWKAQCNIERLYAFVGRFANRAVDRSSVSAAVKADFEMNHEESTDVGAKVASVITTWESARGLMQRRMI